MRAVLVGSVAPSPAAGSGLSGQSGPVRWRWGMGGVAERLESSALGRSWRGSWPCLAARTACAGAVVGHLELESVIEGTPATRPIPAARALLSIQAWGLACVEDARWVGGGLGFQLVRAGGHPWGTAARAQAPTGGGRCRGAGYAPKR
jgi:hypothetical protein